MNHCPLLILVERSSRPVLTVLLLLRTSHQEEPERASSHERAQDLWVVGTSGVSFLLMPVAQKNQEPLEQVYYQIWIMREGWLVDPGTNWVWRFHRDVKAWVRDPKVFMDRGMA